MKRKRSISTCPICGRKANISRKLVKAKSGRIYYYVRFYHGPTDIHFSRTDSSYLSFIIAEKKARNLSSALTDYVTGKMGARKLTYTALKREIEKSFEGVVYNEEFNRSLKKATSVGLIERIMEKDRPLYSKISEVDLEDKLKFYHISVNYDFSGSKMIVSTFLEPINNGQVLIRKIPFFVPYGPVDSLDRLNLKVHDETGETLQQNLSIVFSTALETVFSISLNRNLWKGESDCVFVKYSIPIANHSTSFLILAPVGSLRITIIAESGYDARMLRTLAYGAKETEIQFPKHYFYSDNLICSQIELDSLLKGESISVKLRERQNSSKRLTI